MNSHKNFNLNDKVTLINCGPTLSGRTGYILGKTSQFAECDLYIVMLDVALPENLAVNIAEHCLELI